MPQSIRTPQTPTPSLKGSTPVSEVLGRIEVRDPQHKPSGIHGRRISDYESRSPMIQSVTLMALAAFIVGGFGSLFLQKLVGTWNLRPIPAPERVIPQAGEPLRIPQEIHPSPQTRRLAPTPETSNAMPSGPENLSARFLGSRILELRWDSLGEGYVYQVYTAASPFFKKDAVLVSAQPLPSPQMAWTPDDGVTYSWIAVKGIDPQGIETAFSRPVLVQLPF